MSASPRGNSVLVIGETASVESTHSIILETLRDANRQVTFIASTEKSIPLIADGAYLYDGVILLAPRSTFLSSKLPVSRLIEFVDSGRDLFIASSTSYSAYTEKVCEALGIDLDDKDNIMIDYQRSVELDIETNSTGDWIGAGGLAEKAFGSKINAAEVFFSGSGATFFKDNELVYPLIWGGGSSYGAKGKGSVKSLSKVPRVSGEGAVLAAAVSTRSESRGTWFGSFEALSDSVLQASETHKSAMKQLILWSVSEYGILRVFSLKHASIEDGGVKSLPIDQDGPSEYRVKDVIELEVRIEEWDGDMNDWKGYETEDLQVEFVMLNPWVRTRLVNTNPGVFLSKIQVPDQIGVYKFKVEYVRRGVSALFVEKVVSVRPFLHNEYERFIQMASPYYISCFSMILGAFVLGLVVLYGGDEGWEQVREKAE